MLIQIKEETGVNGSTATTGRYRSYRREMGVRVPRLFPQITFGFGWRHNDASTLFLFGVTLSVKTGSYLVSGLHLDYVLIMFCITKVQPACEDRLHNKGL